MRESLQRDAPAAKPKRTGKGNGRLPAEAASGAMAAAKPPVPRRKPSPSPFGFEGDSYGSTAFSEIVDRSLHALAARFTAGLSPSALAGAYWDWAIHLALSPGKQFQLIEKAAKKSARFAHYAAHCSAQPEGTANCIEPLAQDRRFDGEAWQQWPFNLMHQGFLLNQQWWHNATTGIHGVTRQHEQVMEFAARQMLDVFAPSNYPLSNPEVLQKTMQDGGMNLVRGLQNLREDFERAASGQGPAGSEDYAVGETLAVTPGKVVYRNRLIELIQYAATTKRVRPEPILIVPAWIMKYYILDLSPGKTFLGTNTWSRPDSHSVHHLVEATPGADDRDLGISRITARLGVMKCAR